MEYLLDWPKVTHNVLASDVVTLQKVTRNAHYPIVGSTRGSSQALKFLKGLEKLDFGTVCDNYKNETFTRKRPRTEEEDINMRQKFLKFDIKLPPFNNNNNKTS